MQDVNIDSLIAEGVLAGQSGHMDDKDATSCSGGPAGDEQPARREASSKISQAAAMVVGLAPPPGLGGGVLSGPPGIVQPVTRVGQDNGSTAFAGRHSHSLDAAWPNVGLGPDAGAPSAPSAPRQSSAAAAMQRAPAGLEAAGAQSDHSGLEASASTTRMRHGSGLEAPVATAQRGHSDHCPDVQNELGGIWVDDSPGRPAPGAGNIWGAPAGGAPAAPTANNGAAELDRLRAIWTHFNGSESSASQANTPAASALPHAPPGASSAAQWGAPVGSAVGATRSEGALPTDAQASPPGQSHLGRKQKVEAKLAAILGSSSFARSAPPAPGSGSSLGDLAAVSSAPSSRPVGSPRSLASSAAPARVASARNSDDVQAALNQLLAMHTEQSSRQQAAAAASAAAASGVSLAHQGVGGQHRLSAGAAQQRLPAQARTHTLQHLSALLQARGADLVRACRVTCPCHTASLPPAGLACLAYPSCMSRPDSRNASAS